LNRGGGKSGKRGNKGAAEFKSMFWDETENKKTKKGAKRTRTAHKVSSVSGGGSSDVMYVSVESSATVEEGVNGGEKGKCESRKTNTPWGVKKNKRAAQHK